MIPFEMIEYVCAVRWKKGESEALWTLDDPVKDLLAPHIILPPRSAKDIDKGRPLHRNEYLNVHVGRIATFWPKRPCVLDFRFAKLNDDIGKDAKQISAFLALANQSGCLAIPTVDLRTNEERLAVIRTYWLDTNCGLAIRITLDNLTDSDLTAKLHALLLRLVAKPSECLLVLDLSDADLSDVDSFSTFVLDWILKVQKIGLWRRVVVESSNYPGINPAPQGGGVATIPRNEWLAWQQIISKDGHIHDLAVFGDFGADHGSIDFRPGGKVIAHLRYATPKDWRVERGGSATTTDDGSIHAVARRIVKSGHFAGEKFSAGDEFIADCAANRVEGNPSDWRRSNMNHHMTRAANDLGTLFQKPIPQRQERRKPVQTDLFAM